MLRLILAMALLTPTAALPDEREVRFGLGYDDIFQKRTSSPAVDVEYLSRPLDRRDRFRFMAAGMLTANKDIWVGAGLNWRYPIRNGPWFVEVSLLPGVFYRHDEKPGVDRLHAPMFRTQGVIGYEFATGNTLSFAVSHHSAARLDKDAGNTETIWLGYGAKF